MGSAITGIYFIFNMQVREPAPTSVGLSSCSLFLHICILHHHARPHHVFIEWRPAVFGHEDRLNEQAHLIDIAPQCLGNVELAVAVGRHDDGHVNVAVGGGMALGV